MEPKKLVVQRARKHAKDQRRRGLRRVSVWVPAADVDRVKDIAVQLRRDAGAPLPSDGEPAPRRVEVPRVDGKHMSRETVFLELDADELGLHLLVSANGGAWRGSKKLWEVPGWLPHKLGLNGRVRA